MARKLFASRPRANTTNESISRPTLTFTDAAARLDLQPLHQVSAHKAAAENARPKRSLTVVDRARSHRQDVEGLTNMENPCFRPRTSPAPEDRRSQEEEVIGIALGSPTAAWGHPCMASKSTIATHMSDNEGDKMRTSNAGSNSVPHALKRKPSKWKKFGDLFKTKNPPPLPEGMPFYQVQVNDQPLLPSRYPDFAMGFQFGWDYGAPHATQPSRQHSRKEKESKPRKHAKLVKERSPRKHRGALTQEPRHVTKTERQEPAPLNLLNVDIPDVELERYSVMFGGILGKSQSQTLLDRRSKTLDKLKTHKEGEETRLALQRSATSPAPTKSPSFNVFPPTATSKASEVRGGHCIPRGPSPLPNQHIPPLSPRRANSTPQLKKSTQNQQKPLSSGHTRVDSEAFILYTLTSDAETVDDPAILRRSRAPPIVHPDERKWENVKPNRGTKDSKRTEPQTPPTQKDAEWRVAQTARPGHSEGKANPSPAHRESPPKSQQSPSSSQRPSSSHPARSTGKNLPRPPAPVPNITISVDDFPEESRHHRHHHHQEPPIEISVARSVSVSRRQKQMLVPVSVTGSIARRKGKPGLGGGDGDGDAEERILEKKVGTPTALAVQRGHVHRRSENAVIESA
ncbi:hypothetical protein VTO42DRAFT_1078 [Malbranchea cinnamomea]